MCFFYCAWLKRGAVGCCLLLLLFSCKLPQTTTEIKTDTVTVYRDTTIFIEGRTDTFTVETFIHDTIIKNQNGNSIQIIKLPNDKTKIICHEAEIRIQLDSVLKLISVNNSKETVITKYVCTNEFHQNLIKLFYLLLFIGLLYLGFRVRR